MQLSWVCILLLPFIITISADTLNQGEDGEILIRDICIVGGGASGTYAAIRLRDLGKSIVVIEQDELLGGHVNTYLDPTENKLVDYGVLNFHNLDIVKKYFNRLNVPFQVGEMSEPKNASYVDIKRGALVTNYTASPIMDGLATLAPHIDKYPGLDGGFYLPKPVPEDFLMPISEFGQKYNLKDILDFTFQGSGDILHLPSLYLLKDWGPGIMHTFRAGFITVASGRNQDIYDKALEILKPNVLLSSKVASVDRSVPNNVTIRVQTPQGIKLIRSKKILLAIPQQLENLAGFDLTDMEKELFGTFVNAGYYTALMRNTGLKTGVRNIDQSNPYNLPDLPAVYDIEATSVRGLFKVLSGSKSTLSTDIVQSNMISSVKRAAAVLSPNSNSNPEFVVFQSHSPYMITVPSEAIKSGFYERLYALQGLKDTFHTGSAFQAPWSGLVWHFTENLLTNITKSLS